MNLICRLNGLVIASVLPGIAWADEKSIPPLAHSELNGLLSMIKPQADESSWREVKWITNVTEARQRAVAEDKPIIIFTAADGSPIGRT